MFWALPMLKAVRGLQSCEIFLEYSTDRLIDPDRLISLDDLAAVMCLDSSSPENAPACVQKALQEYPTCEGPLPFPFNFVLWIGSKGAFWLLETF